MLPNVEEIATVVVCEDDEATRELLCDQLTADRYRALPAPSASDALRLCGYNQPDLMVLDLGLPDAPGIDVLRGIRAASERLAPDRRKLDPEGARFVFSSLDAAASRDARTGNSSTKMIDEGRPLAAPHHFRSVEFLLRRVRSARG
jgi:CheY-like chemotaxis protein